MAAHHDIRINQDLTLEISDAEMAQPPSIERAGYLLSTHYGLLLISFDHMRAGGREWPCMVPEDFVRSPVLDQLVGSARVHSQRGDVAFVPGANYGQGMFALPLWLDERLGLLTTDHLRQLRRERQAKEDEERRRRQEIERMQREAKLGANAQKTRRQKQLDAAADLFKP